MMKRRKSPSFLLEIFQCLFGREDLISPEPVVTPAQTDTKINAQCEQKREEVLPLEPEMLLHSGYTVEEIHA